MCGSEYEREINILCLCRTQVISNSQQFSMTNHLVHAPNAKLRHDCAELISNVVEEVDDVLRRAFKLLSKDWILGRYSDRTHIQVALLHHDAPHGNQGR